MTRQLTTLLVMLFLLPVAVPAADPAPGEPTALVLGCALAKAVGFDAICGELGFFRHEGERRMGEELGQLLDATARAKAVKLIDAELADKGRKPDAGKACPSARPLCSFPSASLAAMKDGLEGGK